MANIALSEFRTDVQSALGNRGLANASLDRWINHGYLDLAGGVDFEVFDASGGIAFVQGTSGYAVPAGALIVKAVYAETEATDTLLQYISKEEYFRRDKVTEGTPVAWTRKGDYIYVQPVPDGASYANILYKKSPTKLSGTTDTTELPEMWDPAVWLLACHFGLMALGEEDRAMAYFQRATIFIQTKITEAEYYAQALGLGLAQAKIQPSQLGFGKVQQD